MWRSWTSDEPWKVIARSSDYVLAPHAPYEQVGDVQNVFFPCAALTDGDRISVYYGAADTVTGLAHGHISDLIDFARSRYCDRLSSRSVGPRTDGKVGAPVHGSESAHSPRS